MAGADSLTLKSEVKNEDEIPESFKCFIYITYTTYIFIHYISYIIYSTQEEQFLVWEWRTAQSWREMFVEIGRQML